MQDKPKNKIKLMVGVFTKNKQTNILSFLSYSVKTVEADEGLKVFISLL